MDREMQFCPLCRNHCPLDHPNCSNVASGELRDFLAAKKAHAETHCTICSNQCSYADLQCEGGKLIARLKGKIPQE